MKSAVIFALFIVSLNLIADEYQVGDHELMLMPTAYTMPKGKSYFSDYELVFLNYSYAPTSRTHIGAFTIFPVTPQLLDFFTIGIKQNYYRTEKFNTAVWGTYTPIFRSFTIGNVISYGKPAKSIHLGLSIFDDIGDEMNPDFAYMTGLRYKRFMIEYTNLKSWADNDFGGIISLGFRFGGEKVSWEIGGFRPFEDTGELDILLYPLLKATILF